MSVITFAMLPKAASLTEGFTEILVSMVNPPVKVSLALNEMPLKTPPVRTMPPLPARAVVVIET